MAQLGMDEDTQTTADDSTVGSAAMSRASSNHSLSDSSKWLARTHAHEDVGASHNGTVGQFAFAPATQQTTVVTTTTTTINLAPLTLKAPRSLIARDPKQYPLASTPTPQALRNITFKVGGSLATFAEADDAEGFLGRYHLEQKRLQESSGHLRDFEETKHISNDCNPRSAFARPHAPGTSHHITKSHRVDPPSLAAAAEIASSHRKRAKRKSQSSQQPERPCKSSESRPAPNSAHLADPTSPVTPDTEGALSYPHQSPVEVHGQIGASSRTAGSLQSARRAGSRRHAQSTTRGDREVSAAPSAGLAAATPPIMDSDVEGELPAPAPIRPPFSTLPALLNTSAQQDASLPSPSLSPVTAAANLAQRQQNLTRPPQDIDDVSDMSGLDGEAPTKKKTPPLFDAQPSKALQEIEGVADDFDQDGNQSRTMMDIPEMISMFDALPAELQSYVMFQLLKRSSKKTISAVAEVVNPALKCDPFETLPAEISLKITKFLDGRTMGRAAQVSKRWRHLVNSDETAWRDLLDEEGFVLPEGEIERAINEGWAWQFPRQREAEKDLSQEVRRASRALAKIDQTPQGTKIAFSDEEMSSAARNTRKRKATAPTQISKRQKRKASAPQGEDASWLREIQKGQGPIACASAAARLVPDPKIGLPSLKSLHLFKSIYQRHWMIRKSWMDGSCQPQHLAFRAHHRHVVTCLLFDSDRIITGSDDTSINVFDTKTGVLRRKLEGHEGGVWALACDGNTLVSGSTDRSVRVWNIETGTCMQTFQGHTSTVRCLVILKPTEIGKDDDGQPVIHPNEPVIITGSRDSTLRVWKLPKPADAQMHQAGPPENDTDNRYALRTLTGHHNSVRAIAAHGDTLVSGSYDCTVRVWRISNGEMIHRLQGHAQKVYSVVLDHERNRCISGSMDNLVKVWSLDSGTCLFNLEGHTSLVGLLELSHGSLVSAAADSTLRVWEPENGACRSILSAHTGAITCFQHDGHKVISGSDRTLKMWDINTGACIRDLLTDLSGVWQVAFDERRCVAAVQRNNLTYIEVLDFGASRDGVSSRKRGRRIVVNAKGMEIEDDGAVSAAAEAAAVGVGDAIVPRAAGQP